jgi:hypothetical protein
MTSAKNHRFACFSSGGLGVASPASDGRNCAKGGNFATFRLFQSSDIEVIGILAVALMD